MKITDITASHIPLPAQKIAPTWNSIVQQERSDGARQRHGTRLEVRTDEGITGNGFEADAAVLGRLHDLIEARGVDIVQADPRTCGGITEWLKIASFASAYHLPMAPHGNVYAGADCVAAVANALIVEYPPRLEQNHSNDLYDPPTVKDGHMTLSDEPGLGVPWREDLINRFLAKA